jgi:hypothetical protein
MLGFNDHRQMSDSGEVSDLNSALRARGGLDSELRSTRGHVADIITCLGTQNPYNARYPWFPAGS